MIYTNVHNAFLSCLHAMCLYHSFSFKYIYSCFLATYVPFITHCLYLIFADMSKPIPTFVQSSTKYEDLFKNDDFDPLKGVLDASPISQVAAPNAYRGGLPLIDKRKLSQSLIGPTSTTESRSSKKSKVVSSASPSHKVHNFYKLSRGQIPIETIAE